MPPCRSLVFGSENVSSVYRTASGTSSGLNLLVAETDNDKLANLRPKHSHLKSKSVSIARPKYTENTVTLQTCSVNLVLLARLLFFALYYKDL